MMIDHVSGFAPPPWDCGVGRTLCFRPGGKDLNRDDMCAINEFLGDLLDEYSEGPDFNPTTWLNPSKFGRFVRRTVDNAPGGHTRVFNIV